MISKRQNSLAAVPGKERRPFYGFICSDRSRQRKHRVAYIDRAVKIDVACKRGVSSREAGDDIRALRSISGVGAVREVDELLEVGNDPVI